MTSRSHYCSRAAVLAVILLVLSSCGKKDEPAKDEQNNDCRNEGLSIITGADGNASVFSPDPIAGSFSYAGRPAVSPWTKELGKFSSDVVLEHLGGRGVLEGKYVYVGSGLCEDGFHAFNERNDFRFDPSDLRFEEAMTYHYGTGFRAFLDDIGYLVPGGSIQMVTSCTTDNAYYTRYTEDGKVFEKVCLGFSSQNLAASYAHDALVSVHELQHATSTDIYSPIHNLGELWYDEAGSLNEGVSDFMALAFTAPLVPSGLDSRVFSRWALGTFYEGGSGARGAHKCPAYDSAYPECLGFGSFNSATNTLSYIYPDGLGWPHADNYTGPGKLRSAFEVNRAQEEIHTGGILLSGALWDAYEEVRKVRAGDSAGAFAQVSKSLLEAIKQLPKPSNAYVSPVNFRGLASRMVSSAAALGLSEAEQDAVKRALTDRGLFGGVGVPTGWAESAGLKIMDNPTKLKSWLIWMYSDPDMVTQGLEGGANGKLGPGELAALWFNLRNVSPVTAGGVTLTITSLDPDVTFLGSRTNAGFLSDSEVQIIYGKINGTSIVTSLSQGNDTLKVSTGNTYAETNPFYESTWRTAVFVKVAAGTERGKTVIFRVLAEPSNGEAVTVDFPVTIE